VLWTAVGTGSAGVVLVGLKVLPVVIIGGLDSIPATMVAAVLIGILESVVTGYVDPIVGGGFGHIGAFLVAIAFLFVRPAGLLGSASVRRV
jgi:branched-chain amino acid transport system permease protein